MMLCNSNNNHFQLASLMRYMFGGPGHCSNKYPANTVHRYVCIYASDIEVVIALYYVSTSFLSDEEDWRL